MFFFLFKPADDDFLACDLCEYIFESHEKRSKHILNHFKCEQCESCGKVVYKICDMIFELHGEDSSCCRQTSATMYQEKNDGAAVLVTTSNRIGKMPARIAEFLSNDELEFVVDSDKQTICAVDEPMEKLSRRKSNRVRKKVRSYISEDDDDVLLNRRTLAVTKLEITLDNNSTEATVKEEHLEEHLEVHLEEPTADDGRSLAKSDVDTIVEHTYLTDNKRKKCTTKPRPHRPLSIPCPQCHTLFRTQRTLQIHQKSKHGINPSTECDVCNKVFTSVGNLKQHKQTHNDTRRYICSYCGKGFNLHFNLKDHMNEHTGAKPYVCGICGKAFGKASHRVAHMRVN